jgi:hypothetical protein
VNFDEDTFFIMGSSKIWCRNAVTVCLLVTAAVAQNFAQNLAQPKLKDCMTREFWLRLLAGLPDFS